MKQILTSVLLAFVLSAASAAAMTKDAFAELLLNGDHEEVEAFLVELEADVERGAQNYKHQREFYALFMTTHSKVVEFVEDWADEQPLSHHAALAKGWNQYQLAWIYRGTSEYRLTSDEARKLFDTHITEAARLAFPVWEKRKEMIPAADLVLALSRLTRLPMSEAEVIRQVMIHAPSRRGLFTAVSGSSPRWGGSIGRMFELCETYGDKLREDDNLDFDECWMDAVFFERYYGRDIENDIWVLKQFDSQPLTRYPSERLEHIIFHDPDIDRVLALYEANGEFDSRYLTNIRGVFVPNEFSSMTMGGGLGRVSDDQKKINRLIDILDEEDAKQAERVRKSYAWSPLEPDLILSLERPCLDAIRREDNSQEYREIYARLEQAQMYGQWDPEIWSTLASYHPSHTTADILKRAGYFENAAWLSNYGLHYVLKNYINAEGIKKLYDHAADKGLSSFHDRPVELAKVEGQANCGFVQAARILEAVCESTRSQTWECQPRNEFYQNALRALSEEREEPKLCPSLIDAPIEDLAYR